MGQSGRDRFDSIDEFWPSLGGMEALSSPPTDVDSVLTAYINLGAGLRKEN